jgi:hypothetical protein
LPSKDELFLLLNNIQSNFSDIYWSSSEVDSNAAWYFINGGIWYANQTFPNKGNSTWGTRNLNVRAIRAY